MRTSGQGRIALRAADECHPKGAHARSAHSATRAEPVLAYTALGERDDRAWLIIERAVDDPVDARVVRLSPAAYLPLAPNWIRRPRARTSTGRRVGIFSAWSNSFGRGAPARTARRIGCGGAIAAGGQSTDVSAS